MHLVKPSIKEQDLPALLRNKKSYQTNMQPKQRRLRARESKAQRESGNGSNQVVDEHATIQVILPRRKAGQSAVDRDTVEPVILNRALLQSLFHLPLATASSRLVSRCPAPACWKKQEKYALRNTLLKLSVKFSPEVVLARST